MLETENHNAYIKIRKNKNKCISCDGSGWVESGKDFLIICADCNSDGRKKRPKE